MDWLGSVLVILGMWMTAEKYIWCWGVKIVGAAVWTAFSIQEEIYGMIPLQVVIIPMCVYGYVKWAREELKESE